MAARIRDHKAEGLRRKALAELRGFKNRYEQRKAIETGKVPPLQPKRVKSPKTLKAQKEMLAKRKPSPDFGGIDLPKISPNDRAQDWSDMFARSGSALYEPKKAASLGVSRAEYTQAYLRAFVIGPKRYEKTRRNKRGATPHLFYWFVTLNGYMQADEYESRYGPAA